MEKRGQYIRMKKTPAQKIRDYFNAPKWRKLKEKQEEQYATRR